MGKKASDSVADERPFWGVHILATAIMCAAGTTPDELELARRLLAKDPRIDAPRESESIAGAFNRHMDAALDSANDSIGNPSRASRRASLASDLSRAGLVMVDRSQIALMIGSIEELRAEREQLLAQIERLEGEDLGAELLLGDDASIEQIVDVLGCCNLSCPAMLGIGPCQDCERDPEPRTYQPSTVEHG